MEMLLKISTIPAQFEMNVQHAKLEYSNELPTLEISKQSGGGIKMSSKRAKLNIDTYEARNSVVPTTKTSIYQAAQRGIEAAQALTQQYSSETAQMRWSKSGDGGQMLSKIFAQRAQLPTGNFKLGFMPTTGANITYQKGDLSTDYQMDRLSFELKRSNSNLEYIPGSIDIVMVQHPDVTIEYIGDPMYVPPSAAEKYLGKQLDVSA